MDQLPDLVRSLKGIRRPTSDEYFLLMALLVSSKGTCPRRRVGTVLVDAQHKVIATGYGGNAAGLNHCIDIPCPGAGLPSGTGLDKCEAIHAEENALIQCTRPNDIYYVYSTTSPCIHCVRRLLNTGAKHLVFAELYPHPEAESIWCDHASSINGKRTWTHRPWSTLNPLLSTRPTPAASSEPGRSGQTWNILD